MSLKNKSIVVAAFACRLPYATFFLLLRSIKQNHFANHSKQYRLVAIAGLRLYYLYIEITSSNPTLVGGPQTTACTQIEIGYSILASIVPCIKTFMAPYDKPIMTEVGYQRYGSTKNSAHELGSIASKGEVTTEVVPAMASPAHERVYQRNGRGEDGYMNYSAAERTLTLSGKNDSVQALGILRPERIEYEAKVSHHGHEDMDIESRRDGREGSLDSGNSRRMIIKKGVEWSVDYDTRTTSL